MKTVQQYLKEVNTEKVIDCFVKNINDLNGKALEEYKFKAEQLINKLKFIELTPDTEHTCVIFAHEVYSTEWNDIDYSLIYLNDDHSKHITTYSFYFSSLSEIASFYVSDNDLTQEHIDELLAYVLNECSFFGFNQERLEEAKESLEQAIEEIKNSNVKDFKTLDEVMADLGMNIERNEEKEEEKKKINRLIFEYNEKRKKEEIDKMKERE